MNGVNLKPERVSFAVLFIGAMFASACSRDVAALTPQQVEQDYGVVGAQTGTVSTPDGQVRGTLVPVTLADGRRPQLLIPARSRT